MSSSTLLPTILENKTKELVVVNSKQTVSQDTILIDTTVMQEEINSNFTAVKPKPKRSKFMILNITLLSLVIIFALTLFSIFSYLSITSSKSNNIHSGIYINGVDLSNCTTEEANLKMLAYIEENTPEYLYLSSGEFETSILTSSLEITNNLDELINLSYIYGKNGGFMQNGFDACHALINNEHFTLELSFNEDVLIAALNDMSPKLPNALMEGSCYIENNELLIFPGSAGEVVNVDAMVAIFKTYISTISLPAQSISIQTTIQEPIGINIDHIYSQVYATPKNASYTQEPYSFTASETGIDFAITIDEAKQLVSSPSDKYVIPLQVLYPEVSTSSIGLEAFPDILGSFTTYYNPYEYNRTNNVTLSASKVTGIVLMPGEIFSYNNTVGVRSIATGFKSAGMYLNGEVVDAVGGGICQTATSLYNAALYANLEIVERSNHTFIPSYATASRDATVVYGVIDFQFKNNRDYPIKITISTSGGKQYAQINGFRTDEDYDVTISSYQTGSSSTHIYAESYRILSKNGAVVEKQLLAKDVYKKY